MCKDGYGQYFVAYFDFLGFTEYVKNESLGAVLSLYKKAIKNVRKKAGIYFDVKKTPYQWFSDTFLFCARIDKDGPEKAFMDIYRLATTFFRDMLQIRMPLRGALTVGKLYVEPEDGIYFGEALIEAYEYAESQNWLGFVLTPKVIPLLEQHGFTKVIELVNREFVKYTVPCHNGQKRTLLVWRLDKWNSHVNIKWTGSYYLWSDLISMEEAAPENAKEKYCNSKKFMTDNCPKLKELLEKEKQNSRFRPAPE